MHFQPDNGPGREQRLAEEKERETVTCGNSARENESVLAAVIRARRPVICGRAGLLIVTRTPPRFYIFASRTRVGSPFAYGTCNALSTVRGLYLLLSRNDGEIMAPRERRERAWRILRRGYLSA